MLKIFLKCFVFFFVKNGFLFSLWAEWSEKIKIFMEKDQRLNRVVFKFRYWMVFILKILDILGKIEKALNADIFYSKVYPFI